MHGSTAKGKYGENGPICMVTRRQSRFKLFITLLYLFKRESSRRGGVDDVI